MGRSFLLFDGGQLSVTVRMPNNIYNRSVTWPITISYVHNGTSFQEMCQKPYLYIFCNHFLPDYAINLWHTVPLKLPEEFQVQISSTSWEFIQINWVIFMHSLILKNTWQQPMTCHFLLRVPYISSIVCMLNVNYQFSYLYFYKIPQIYLGYPKG